MKIKRNNIYLTYTLLFAFVAALCFSFFFRYRKTMIWSPDGLYQHYNAFLYLGSWCRAILKGLIYKHQLIIPMWEWGLGYGADILTTLSYYTFGDPFALVAVFTPFKYGEVGYAISIILRFYAAGIAFCLYCKKMKCRKWSTICAALMYTFCAYSLLAGVRHPYFISPMIYFPLVLLGCEKIIRKESIIPFSVAVFLAAVSNFYFFYMIVLLTIIYVLVRLLSESEYRNFKILCGYFICFFGAAVLGVALAAVIFLPNVMNFLTNSRVNDSYKYNALYSLDEYEALLGAFVGIGEPMNWAVPGVAPLAYLGVGAIFLQKSEENRWTKIYFFLGIIFLIFPLAGHIFNGFGYVVNRWVFAWVLIVTYMFAKGAADLLTMKCSQKVFISIGCIIYALLCVYLEKSRIEYNMVGCMFLLASVLLLWCADYLNPFYGKQINVSKSQLQQNIVLLLTLLLVFEGAYYRYSLVEGNYLNEFYDQNTGLAELKDGRASAWNIIDDDQFYRIDNSINDNSQLNYLISSGQSTTTAYWSLINPNIAKFLQYNNAYLSRTYVLTGLCSRSWLLPLVSARYFVGTQSSISQASVPYRYDNIGESGQYLLYYGKDALPFGYTYDSMISLNDFEQMSIPERQQAMLQGAVLEDDGLNIAKLNKNTLKYSDFAIPFKITCDGNVTLNGNTVVVKNNNAAITLSLDTPVSKGELYVQLSGLGFKSQSEYDFWSPEEWDSKSRYEREKIRHDLKYWVPATSADITATCKDATISVTHHTDFDTAADGRTKYLLNLGYSEDKRTDITLNFSERGIYTLDNLSIICQPMEQLDGYVEALQKDVLENVKMTTNQITGTITLDKPKLLCMSLPYSNGWTAYVDGARVDLLRTNIMLSGIELEAGTHMIKLVYRTPYIMSGLVISVSALSVLAALVIFARKRKRKDSL